MSVRVTHWNVNNKTNFDEKSFQTDLQTLAGNLKLGGDHIVFLTEILSGTANIQTVINIFTKTTGFQWNGKLIYAGISQGGARNEWIAVLHNLKNEPSYLRLISTTNGLQEVAWDSQAQHNTNSRYPVGVTFTPTNEAATIKVAGYHNLGPSTGATTEATRWRSALYNRQVHITTGDWNVAPPKEVGNYFDTQLPDASTRAGKVFANTRFGKVATTRGGNYYDYALATYPEVQVQQTGNTKTYDVIVTMVKLHYLPTRTTMLFPH